MDELLEIYNIADSLDVVLQKTIDEGLEQIRQIFQGTTTAIRAVAAEPTINATPVQKVKRAKRLSALTEDEEGATTGERRNPTRSSNSELLKMADELQKADTTSVTTVRVDEKVTTDERVTADETVAANATVSAEVTVTVDSDYPNRTAAADQTESCVEEETRDAPIETPSSDVFVEPLPQQTGHQRPQRQAKLKSEKNLKEPKLNSKLRRPEISGQVKIEPPETDNDTTADVEILGVSLSETNNNKSLTSSRKLSVKVKREKLSSSVVEEVGMEPVSNLVFPLPAQIKVEMPLSESSMTNNITSADSVDTTAKTQKKGRKQKQKPVHKPIKVERFSSLDEISSPIASRTRNLSGDHRTLKQQYSKQQSSKQQHELHTTQTSSNDTSDQANSVYEDAVNNLSDAANAIENGTDAGSTTIVCDNQNEINNETVTIAKSDATFCTAKDGATNPESNINATFAVSPPKQEVKAVKGETAKIGNKKLTSAPKLPKEMPIRMPTRAKELFNPLIQSPVKMKVRAFENATALNEQTRNTRPKRTKENTTESSAITPLIGKINGALGRFLTPTQGPNILPYTQAAKKGPNSASKVMVLPKAVATLKNAASSSSISSSGTSSKVLSRENSTDDLRKIGMQQLAEDRKKQREQKTALAAQRREMKERERLAKIAKQREERQQKKHLEEEHKKRELEAIQKKLRQQEEFEAAEKAKQKAARAKQVLEQERLLLQQIKKQQQQPEASNTGAKPKTTMMMPPPGRHQQQYTFDMLHEDDSTDEETKVTHKRPAPPLWSQSKFRGPSILMQQYFPNEVLDSFFSVQPMTINLKEIFPHIDARHLKRNSSVFWSTPPRHYGLHKF